MAVNKIVDLGPRGFDSLILPRAVLRIPMPTGNGVPVQFALTHTVRPRNSYGLFIGRKPNRIMGKFKSK